MIKQIIEYSNTGFIICPHCNEKYLFNRHAIIITQLLIYINLGLWVASYSFPLIVVIVFFYLFITFLGMPLELILNATIFSLFFPLEKITEST